MKLLKECTHVERLLFAVQLSGLTVVPPSPEWSSTLPINVVVMFTKALSAAVAIATDSLLRGPGRGWTSVMVLDGMSNDDDDGGDGGNDYHVRDITVCHRTQVKYLSALGPYIPNVTQHRAVTRTVTTKIHNSQFQLHYLLSKW
jgi:hypothetical protein